MDFKWVKNYLEKTSASSNDIDSTPFAIFEPLIMSGLKVDLVERGRVICSMKVPPRLLVKRRWFVAWRSNGGAGGCGGWSCDSDYKQCHQLWSFS
ncbi:putative acyl-coenzyme A thioesterase 13 [Helianthus anomalus]